MLGEPQNETRQGLHRILIATDFSAAAERARDYAIALAARGTSVMVLHAHPLPLPDTPEPAYVPGWMATEPGVREEALERLHRFGAPARAAGLAVGVVLQEGLPADVILAHAATLQPHLIAMGTHGRRPLGRWVLGSTAERVSRLAAVPVLTVSTHAAGPPARIREVLCPVSLEGGAETVAFASAMARRSGSALTVMHVRSFGDAPGRWREKAAAQERLLEAVAAAGEAGHAAALLRVGHPSREILRLAAERSVDVIVMGAGRLLPDRAGCFGRTADEVVREAPCAVIRLRSAVERESREALEARLASV